MADKKRDISFRVYGVTANGEYKMYYSGVDVCSIDIQKNGEVEIYIGDVDGEQFQLFEYDFMDSTGLKDKNGKEIYEGDVVRVKNRIYKIIYSEQSLSWRIKDKICSLGLDIDYIDSNFWEIIGNVKENPELLKEPTNG